MMTAPPCATSCSLVADLLAARAVDRGTTVAVQRAAVLDEQPHTHQCCHGDTWPSAGAAAECPCDPTRPTRTTITED